MAAGEPLHDTWKGMLARYEDPGHKSFKDYGAQGTAVCTEWHDFKVFAAWIEEKLGPRPAEVTASGHPEYSLDRINPDGNYEPGNVRWATWSQQQANKRKPGYRKRHHEYTPANTYITSLGHRVCRTCHRQRMRQARAEHAQALLDVLDATVTL